MNHYYKLKDTLNYYKEKGVEKTVLCFADPITGWIKNEISGLKIEDFYEVEVGKHQIRIKQEEGEKTLLVLLSKRQIYPIYPDITSRLIETKYEEIPEFEFTMFDTTISNKLPVGYCHLQSHKGLVSKNMLDNRKCVAKQCPYLERFESHQYWIQRNQLKEKKKQKKKDERFL